MSTCDSLYTYRKRELQNILEKKFAVGCDSCYLFNVEHGTEQYIDSSYGVCMH